MRVLIIGAGAIGSLMAYRLSVAGHQVVAVGRAPYVRAIRQRGLLVEANGKGIWAPPFEAVESLDQQGGKRPVPSGSVGPVPSRSVGPAARASFDLVLITTKAFDTAVAAVQVQPFVREDTWTVVLQNGIGGIEIASGILGERNLYAGVVTIPVEVLKPGVISPRGGKGGLGLAPVTVDSSPDLPGEQELAYHPDTGPVFVPPARIFRQAGFEVCSCASWRALKWSKLMLNTIANAIPAILDRPLHVYADRELYRLERDALCEARAVVRQMGLRLVSLPGYPVVPMVWALCVLPPAVTHLLFRHVILGARGGKRASLHIDLSRAKGKSEVEYLNGAIVQAGQRLGIPTPVNRFLCETVLRIARGEVEWSAYRGQVKRLIAEAQRSRA